MTMTTRDPETTDIRTDDYHVEGDADEGRPTVGLRIVWGLQILLIIVLAILSFAVFFVVGQLLNLF